MDKTYAFREVKECNMCGASVVKHRLLGKRLNKSQGFYPAKKRGISTTIFQCMVCGLIFSNPQPIPINLQDHYGVPPENYWKPEYFKHDDHYFSEQIGIIHRMMNNAQGLTSLDIGAGLGKQMRALSKAGFDAFGFEPSQPFYERALSKMGISPDKLKRGSIEDVDYQNEFFDFISFGAVLEHLHNPSWSLKKAFQWLKVGGIMHVEVPNSDWLINRLVNIVYKLRGLDYVGNLSPMHEPYHLYEFSLKSFEIHSQHNNYKIEFHQYHVCETYMPKILDLVLLPLMHKTNTGMQLTVWLRKLNP